MKSAFLLLLLLVAIIQASPPKITKFDQPTIAQVPFQGDTLVLECLASGDPTPTIEFRKNGTAIQLGPDPRITISANKLTITNANYAVDDGIYVCAASNREGAVLSNEITIKIKVLGDFVFPNRYTDALRTVDVTVGRPLELACPPSTYTYPRTIFWGDLPANAQPIVWSVSSKRFQLANGNLFYTYVEEADVIEVNTNLGGVSCLLYIEGRYRASVKTTLRRIGSLTTDFSPFLRENVQPQNQVTEGSDYSFYCSATGNPLPTVSWFKNGQLITASTPGVTVSPTRNKLTVVKATKLSVGTYKCEASNRLGTVSSEGQLSLDTPPKWIRPFKDTAAGLGNRFTFNCSASATPTPEYEWFRNGVSLTNQSGTANSTTSFKVDGSLLTSDKLNASDVGILQCFARNIHGSIVSTGRLAVGAGFGEHDAASFGVIVLLIFAALIYVAVLVFVLIYICITLQDE